MNLLAILAKGGCRHNQTGCQAAKEFAMEKHDARALTAPNIYGSQNFVAAAVLPTAFSTGVN